MRRFAVLPLMALVLTAPALAQDAPPSADEGEERPQPTSSLDEEGQIVVRAGRLPGQLDVPQQPLVELDAEDIAAYGVSSIEDLVAQLGPATGSSTGRGGGGRPVFLINGIRVSSFREFFAYPPEALRKVEVLPEEVAQKFGFPADRRVVNFILKDNFSSREVELEYEQPWDGGYSRTEQEFTLLKLTDKGRINFNLEASDTSLLTESERDIIQTPGSLPTVPGDPDPATGRSLISDSAGLEGTLSYTKSYQESGATLSLTGNLERNESGSLSGFNTVTLVDGAGNSELRTFGEPLEVRSRTDNANASLGYSRPLGEFQLTVTANAGIVDTTTEIDQRADTRVAELRAQFGLLALDGPLINTRPTAFDTASTQSTSASTKATLRGSMFRVPAGDVNVTFDGGYDWSRIDSEDTRGPGAATLTRGVIDGGVNVSIPLTSTRENFLGGAGEIGLNLQAGFDDLSDFGTLYDWSATVSWSLFDNDLFLSATYFNREVAPSLAFLGNPEIRTFNAPVFDFRNNTTELVTITSGGNPNLLAETQKDWKFSGNVKIPIKADMRLNVTYARNRSDNVSRSFPALTDATEAAFPDRVTRDAAGTLLAIDRRPVTFAETRTESLNIGLTLRGQIGGGSDARGGRRGGPGGSGGPPPSQPAQGNGPPAGAGGPGGAQFQQMREKFCATPEGEMPDLSGIPERMLERLRGEDGKIDPAKVKQARERLCGEEGAERSERFAAIRTALCADPPRIEDLPEQMQARLRNEDGSINAERLAQMKQRLCSGEGGQQGQGGAGSQQAQSSPAVRFNPFDRRGPRGARYFLNVTHTIQLKDTVLVAPGGPLLDQLDGDSTSAFGLPRHTTRLEGGLFFGGYGMRLSGRYTGKADLSGSGLPASTDLFFDDLATFDLRLFANLGEVFKQEEGFLKNFRVSLRADNIFDGRRTVRDSNGDTPLSYQPDLIDPTGRYVGIDLRKLF